MKISNINAEAEYEIRVGHNTYWVPISSIGKPHFKAHEIKSLIYETPEKVRDSIYTLYDAIQLFELREFKEKSDNIIINHNNFDWEFHKPGYYSVLTNEGCCASNTSWLLYVLNGKYDHMGVLALIRETGNGHSLNYIQHEGWFYFIDLLSHVGIHRKFSPPETGYMVDFAKSKYNTGIFIKSKTINDFLNFYNRFCIYNKMEHLFYSFSDTLTCIPIATKMENGILYCIFPDNFNSNIQIYNECKNIKKLYNKAPIGPDWSKIYEY